MGGLEESEHRKGSRELCAPEAARAGVGRAGRGGPAGTQVDASLSSPKFQLCSQVVFIRLHLMDDSPTLLIWPSGTRQGPTVPEPTPAKAQDCVSPG